MPAMLLSNPQGLQHWGLEINTPLAQKISTAKYFFGSLLLSLLFLAPSASTAQSRELQLLVVDDTQQPLPAALVRLRSISTDVLSGEYSGYTDNDGQFSTIIPPSKAYALTVSFLGYATFKDTLWATITDTLIKHQVSLQNTSKALKTVTVKAVRTYQKMRIDGMEYEAGEDPANIGLSTIDILRKAPMVSIGPRGELLVRGQSGVVLYLNGRRSALLDAANGGSLDQLPPGAIKRIEVITEPSAEHDGDAVTVINIITKSNPLKGIFGSLNASIGNRSSNSYASIGWSEKLWDVTVGVFGNATYQPIDGNNDIYLSGNSGAVQTIAQVINGKSRSHFFTPSLQITRRLSNNRSLILEGRWGSSAFNSDYQATTLFATNNQQIGYLHRINAVKNEARIGNASLDYRYQPVDQSSSWRIAADVSSQLIGVRYSFRPEVIDSLNQGAGANDNPVHLTNYTLRTDLSGEALGGQFQVGAKGLVQAFTSKYTSSFFAGTLQPEGQPSFEETGGLSGIQWVAGLYTSQKYRLSRRYTARFGLRGEVSDTWFNTPSNNNDSYRIDWLPSFLLSRSFSSGGQLKFSYRRSVRRPGASFRNPNVVAVDPFATSGNSNNLTNSPLQTLSLTYQGPVEGLGSTSISATYDRAQWPISPVTTASVNGLSTRTTNLDLTRSWGIQWWLSWYIGKTFSASSTLEGRHTTLLLGELKQKGWTGSANFNATLRLSPLWSLQGSGNFLARRLRVQGWESSFFFYTFSAQYQAKNGKTSINIGIDNPFGKSFTWAKFLEGEGFTQTDATHFYNRGFRIGINRRFGKPRTAPTTDNFNDVDPANDYEETSTTKQVLRQNR